jgi:starch-binding outer membrane protein SusE/F
MRSIKSLSIIFVLLAFVSCRKYDLAKNEATGEGINGFTLKAPANNTNLVLNAATPNAPVVMEWNAATPGIKTVPTYRWIAALKNGSLHQPLLEIASDGNGSATRLTITQKAIDDILKSKGIPDAAKTDLKWTVTANNGTSIVRATDSFYVSITRFGDGASPFILLSP